MYFKVQWIKASGGFAWKQNPSVYQPHISSTKTFLKSLADMPNISARAVLMMDHVI